MAIACFVFTVCVGGMIYIRMESAGDFPTAFDETSNSTKITEYVTRSLRTQYFYEGFIVSGLMVSIGLCYVMVNRAHKVIHNPILLRIVMVALLTAIYFLQDGMYKIEEIKMPWFKPTMQPPGNYYKGGLLAN
mmetsp:Transcript_15345/g.23635  ORF Transcript_15345/g.23635 Transcript_15345/m.23635 type:complete len:133 (+) Transcript_15345:714-1112(+)